MKIDSSASVSAHQLLERSSALGQSYYRQPVLHKLRRSLCHKVVDIDGLARVLEAVTPPDVTNGGYVATAITAECSVIMDTADRFSKRQE